MTPQQALQDLLANPDYFIKHYPIKIAGSANPHNANQANLRNYFLTKQDPAQAGTTPSQKVGHKGATRPGRILPFRTHEISSFFLDTYQQPNVPVQPVNALSVPMINYSPNPPFNIANLDPYFVDGTGAGIMVTGQLSGCCFCWLRVGGVLWCTHIRPTGIVGLLLQNQIALTGRFAGQVSPIATFGVNDYGTSRATVIGVRHNGNWALYAQTSNDSNQTIAQAFRIHPGAVAVL